MEELKHKTENLFLDYHAAWDKLNKEKNDLALEKAIVSSLRESAMLEIEARKQEYTEEIARMSSKMKFCSQKIKLDVGGIKYSTTVATLTSIEGTMLASMFSGRFVVPQDPEDGSYFIDRDGEAFRYILNYLRDPTQFEIPSEPQLKRDILREARFYCISDLVGMIDPPEVSEVVFTSCRSFILQDDLIAALIPMLSELYGSVIHFHCVVNSDAGLSPSNFSPFVKGRQNIIVIIESTNGHVFGGYVEDSLNVDGEGSWIEGSSNNFVFSLTGSPIKLVRTHGEGIHTGDQGFQMNSDLMAFTEKHACIPTVYTTVAPGYPPVSLLPGTVCGTPGEPYFSPKRIEVFTVCDSSQTSY